MEEELLEAEVLWPETPPPPPPSSRGHGRHRRYQYLPPPSTPEQQYELADTSSCFSCESFGEPPPSSSSSSSCCFLSGVLPSTSAGDAASEEFLEADVLWPDDDVRGGELWWRLRCAFGVDAAAPEPAVAGHREACRPLASSSPIDIPTSAAARRRPPYRRW